MTKHLFTIIFRSLANNKFYTTSIIIGFSAALTIAYIIISFLAHELQTDKFHIENSRVIRIVMDDPITQKKGALTFHYLPGKLEKYPEVKVATHIFYPGATNITIREETQKMSFSEDRLLYVDANFFKVFLFSSLQNSGAEFGVEPRKIILSKEKATKFFRTDDVIGRYLMIKGEEYTIVGILDKPQNNSHLAFDILVSKASLPEPQFNLDYAGMTYARLKPSAQLSDLEQKINKDQAELLPFDLGVKLEKPFVAQPIEEIYFDKNYSNEFLKSVIRTRDPEMIRIFIMIAVSILGLSIFNYVNFSQTKAVYQLKEIVVKKIHGASNFSFKIQLVLESLVLVTAAALISLFLIYGLLPVFNSLTNSTLAFNFLGNISVFPFLLCLILIISTVLGLLSAGIVSKLNISNSTVLNVNVSSNRLKFLNSVNIFQFVLSLILITFTSIVINQISFIKSKPSGFLRENVVEIQLKDLPPYFNPQNLKHEIERLPQVISATVCLGSPLTSKWTYSIDVNGAKTTINSFTGDVDFVRTLDFRIINGRGFNVGIAGDTTSILANEQAAKLLGLDKNFLPIDKEVKLSGEVIGIVKDFHFSSLKERPGPALIGFHSFKRVGNGGAYLLVSLSGNPNEFLNHLNKLWESILPDLPIEYSFVDEKYLKLYKNEFNQSDLLITATIVSLIINVFGLMGLTLFTAQKRAKEVAIRKVLGSSVQGIIMMFFKQTILSVGVSILIAIPIASYLANDWLSNFAYKAPQSVLYIISGIVLMITIAFAVVLTNIYRTATKTPSDVLRHP